MNEIRPAAQLGTGRFAVPARTVLCHTGPNGTEPVGSFRFRVKPNDNRNSVGTTPGTGVAAGAKPASTETSKLPLPVRLFPPPLARKQGSHKCPGGRATRTLALPRLDSPDAGNKSNADRMPRWTGIFAAAFRTTGLNGFGTIPSFQCGSDYAAAFFSHRNSKEVLLSISPLMDKVVLVDINRGLRWSFSPTSLGVVQAGGRRTVPAEQASYGNHSGHIQTQRANHGIR